MKTHDKLARCRTRQIAILTAQMDIPFWFGLTAHEHRSMTGQEKMTVNLREQQKRREFRQFIRTLCG